MRPSCLSNVPGERSGTGVASAVAALLLWLTPAATAFAQWNPNGVPLGPNSGIPVICSDRAGGAYVAWDEYRNGQYFALIQRVSGAGALPPGWDYGGARAIQGDHNHFVEGLVADGLGGVLLSMQDLRSQVTHHDVYLQRFMPDGSLASEWPADAVPVAPAPRTQLLSRSLADGTGGALVVWEDKRAGLVDIADIYAQRVMSDGTIAPGWPADGLPICTEINGQGLPFVFGDGEGGALIVWSDARTGAPAVFAQRITFDGAIAAGWPIDGRQLITGFWAYQAIDDGQGGVYLGLGNNAPWPYLGSQEAFAVARIDIDGNPHSGWPANGVLVSRAGFIRQNLSISTDGVGGVLLSWEDYRNHSTSAADIYAMRIQSDGNPAPGWTANGLRVTNLPGFESASAIASDADGGAYLAYEVEEYPSYDEFVLVQHLLPTGEVVPGWPPNGRNIMANPGGWEFSPAMVTDGAGGVIVAWESYTHGEIRAQRFAADGPVAVLLSLVNAAATPEAVRLVWHGAEASLLAVNVERRSGVSPEWVRVGSAVADAVGRIEFEDRSVRPGGRYAYRLVWTEHGAAQATDETWVEVPRSLELALDGFRPNPSPGRASVTFVLPAAGPARMEVLDVAGRRVFSRDIGALGPGRHAVPLDGTPLTPGVYVIRLVRDGRVLHTRGVVTR